MRVPGIPYVQGRNDYTDWDGRKYGIAIHNTSNDASDEGEASYATRRTDGVSSHLYADDDSVTQSLDLDDRAGHAGSRQGNDHSVAVEITGSNGKSRAWWLANVAWDQLGWVLAWIITHDPDYDGFQVRRASVAEMRRNPRVKAFYGHDDMRLAWGGTTHTDPGPNFPWDRLMAAVNGHLGRTEEDDVSWQEDLWVPDWIMDRWGEAWPDRRIATGPLLMSTYGQSRLAQERTARLEVGQRAVLAHLAGEDVAATVEGLLDAAAQRERAERQAELAGLAATLGPSLLAELGDVAAELPAEVVEAAVGRALQRTSLTVAPADPAGGPV